MLNVNMLKGKMVEKGITGAEMAEKLKINPSTFYRKLKNNSFLIYETDIIVDVLNLSANEASNIFFGQTVA